MRKKTADQRDRFLRRALARHGGGELGKARGLADDEPVQRERLRRQRGMEDEAGEPAQDFREVRAGDERHGGRRPQAFDDPMEDGAEQRRLVLVAVIERPLRDAGALRDGFDAGGAVAALEKQLGRGIEDAIAQLRRFLARGATAAATGRRGGLAVGQRGPPCV